MATRKILFRGQTRHKGEKTSISGKPLPGIWVTGGIFPQNKGYERAIIYTQDPKVEKHVVYAETVGQYTGVDDVLETPVFEDDIITFWQRTDTKHMQRYKGIVKYDEALTSFTVVSCIPTLPIAVFPPPVNETEKTCSQCSQTLRFSLPPASASTPQNLSSSRM